MYDLALKDGDLFIGDNGHKLVTGLPRVIQGLSIALREEYGVDRFHPTSGSALQGLIGSAVSGASLPFFVESEVRRVVENWMQAQFLMFRDGATQSMGGTSGVRSDEIVTAIRDIQVSVREDRVAVLVSLETLAGTEATLVQMVEDS